MKRLLLIFLLFISLTGYNQSGEMLTVMKTMHQSMLGKKVTADQFIHDSLTYGHSNGWIENAAAFRKNLGSYIEYHSIKEDSVEIASFSDFAHIRFVADIDVSMKGERKTFRLKVLEVYVKENNKWKLFARQAVK